MCKLVMQFIYVSVKWCKGREEELRGLVQQHSVILALPDCAPPVELKRDSRSMIS